MRISGTLAPGILMVLLPTCKGPSDPPRYDPPLPAADTIPEEQGDAPGGEPREVPTSFEGALGNSTSAQALRQAFGHWVNLAIYSQPTRVQISAEPSSQVTLTGEVEYPGPGGVTREQFQAGIEIHTAAAGPVRVRFKGEPLGSQVNVNFSN